ncbi:outer membrane protein [Mesorhizobium sp. VNQ89]|uniref:outer membrane protein n=1 Tax=Mesorhizobium quangtriensis TaxID=3157709 RepID=UPI0032B78CF0
MKAYLITAALLVGTSSFALAADAIVEEVVVVDSAYNWSGVYVGAQAGWTWLNSDLFEFESPSDEIIDEGFTLNRSYDGFSGGAFVGYNHQFTNNVVLGAEADFTWTGIDESSLSDLDAGDGVEGDDFQRTSLDWYSTIRARLGYATGRFLPYVTGGVAFGKVAVEFGDLDSGVPDDDDFVSGSSTQVGWTIGGGLEYAFSENLVGRAEYLYVDLGDKTYGNADGDSVRFDTDLSAVRLGIAYKF